MLLVFGLFIWESQEADRKDAAPTPLTPPTAPPSVAEAVPDIPFADITGSSDVRFMHFNGARGEKLLPETMGSGVAIFDFDADGRQDLLFANGSDWPWTASRATPPPTPRLFHNLGNGRFADATAPSGFAPGHQGTGIAVGDFDNDGLVDVFFTGIGAYRLYHNEGEGRFQDVTAAVGLVCKPDDWSTSAAWVDYDNDGDLDLFICHYVRWTRGT